jgi:hypothetical protein
MRTDIVKIAAPLCVLHVKKAFPWRIRFSVRVRNVSPRKNIAGIVSKKLRTNLEIV